MIADVSLLNRFTDSSVGTFTLAVIALMSVCVLALLGIIYGRAAFGRKPPISEDLQQLRKELRNLAPREVVDPLIEKLGDFATRADLEKVKEQLHGYVDQMQMERRMTEIKNLVDKIERDHDAQLKEIRSYVHEEVHAFRNMAQATWAAAEHQREGLHARMNVMAEAVSEMRGWMRAINKRESATH